MKKILIATLMVLVFCSVASAGWEGPGFYMLAGGTNVHYFAEKPGNPNITFVGGAGDGGGGDATSNSKSFAAAKAKAEANAKAMAKQKQTQMQMTKTDVRVDIKTERAPVETIQPSGQPMPLIAGDTWEYPKKWGNFFGDTVAVTAPANLKRIELYQYVFDPLETLMFRKMRGYDVEPKLLAIAQERGTAIEVKVRCMDGSEAGGMPFFFGGGGADSTGLTSSAASAMPTKNWSHSSAVCVILEYIR